MSRRKRMSTSASNQRYLWAIVGISIVIPLIVAMLVFVPFKIEGEWQWIYTLPHLNALINTSTAILLVLGWIFIKRKKYKLHKNTMLLALGLGTIFLIFYIIYHATVPSTVYGDTTGDGLLTEEELATIGCWRTVYLTILFSHITLAAVVVPLILLALLYAFTGRIAKHKKIVKYTWPIWFYVSVSGVVVYGMISPYYQYQFH